MSTFLRGGQRLFLLLALGATIQIHAQSANDARFLSTLGELREADYSSKAGIIQQLSQTGHASVRPVLTALLEERLYFRNNDRKIFIVKAADSDPFNLIDPLSLKSAGSAPASDM